jgi:integrase
MKSPLFEAGIDCCCRPPRAPKANTPDRRSCSSRSPLFDIAREWGLTTKENPSQDVRKNKESTRDYYANDVVWNAVYKKAAQKLKDAIDLAYLTGQRPADVLVMRKDDVKGGLDGVAEQDAKNFASR